MKMKTKMKTMNKTSRHSEIISIDFLYFDFMGFLNSAYKYRLSTAIGSLETGHYFQVSPSIESLALVNNSQCKESTASPKPID